MDDIFTTESTSSVVTQLSKLEANDEPEIYLVLDSPGGSVFAGLSLINYLQAYKKPVHTITLFSASMGFQTVQGNTGKRLIVDTGVLMSHPMSGGEYGEFGKGLSIENRIKFLNEIIDTMDNKVVARSEGKLTLESYRKAYDNELWITGEQSVINGYADEVVQVGCSAELANKEKEFKERSFLGSSMGGVFSIEIKYTRLNCPLSPAITKYQVSIIELFTGKRLDIINSGYPTADTSASESNSIKEILPTIKNTLESNLRYKALMFYLNRNKTDIKSFVRL